MCLSFAIPREDCLLLPIIPEDRLDFKLGFVQIAVDKTWMKPYNFYIPTK